MKEIGIQVYQHYGTHEKIVAIDGHILYDGSLNVLSHTHGSKETMTRTDSKRRLQKKISVLIKNHPQLKEALTESCRGVGKVVDLTPEKFQNVFDSIRSKNKELPKSKMEAKDYYRNMLKNLRRVIADDKRIPYFAVLFNDTIEAMLDNPPTTVKQLLSLPEFRRNRTNIRGYEHIVLEILREYREVTSLGVTFR